MNDRRDAEDAEPLAVPALRDSGFVHARGPRRGNPLAFPLSIHRLDRVVSELIPFFGEDCPVEVVCRVAFADDCLVRGTLATIQREAGSLLNERSTLVVVG